MTKINSTIKTRPRTGKLPAIALSQVTKIYELHHEKPTFAEQILMRQEKEYFTSLDGISLEINQGEKVGIIGHNGAGKTTLLKVITGITTPNRGQVTTIGRIGSLIDVSAGFHPDLSGRENIFLNGLLLGMQAHEVEAQYQKIVRYADIGNFITAPFYTYSTGMKLRLGFSVAVHAKPDILILDEGITAGDENFRKKTLKKMEDFLKAKKTVLIVSHWLEFLEENVSRVVWMEQGKIRADGGVEVITAYRRSFQQRSKA